MMRGRWDVYLGWSAVCALCGGNLGLQSFTGLPQTPQLRVRHPRRKAHSLPYARKQTVVVGDANARHPRWDVSCHQPNPRAVSVLEALREPRRECPGPTTPTISFRGPMGSSCVDLLLTFGTAHVIARFGDQLAGSDHCPMMWELATEGGSTPATKCATGDNCEK